MLWIAWFELVWQLKPAFSREKTFFWGIIVLMSFSVRSDMSGVTSFIRSHFLAPRFYTRLLAFFHSTAIDLDLLTKIWGQMVLKIFHSFLVQVNGRVVLIADGIKIAKEGRKMPGVKLLHQSSQNNSKSAYIMGHSCQAISILVTRMKSFVAIPLASRIHEGIKRSNRDRRTLMDKLLQLLISLTLNRNYYLIADAYYATSKIILGLVKDSNHLISRVKSNAVAYYLYKGPQKARGRKRFYGRKIKLKTLFKEFDKFVQINSPVYGEEKVLIRVYPIDLICKSAGVLVKFVLVIHPTRGKIILMSTDLSLDAISIVKLYGYRFKIEFGFKEAIHRVGTYAYHFWMKDMDKNRRKSGDQYLHKKSKKYRFKFLNKFNAYQVHIQIGVVAQGLLHYLSIVYPNEIWKSFGSWLRTIRPELVPSIQVVSMALREGLLEFLLVKYLDPNFEKFMHKRFDLSSIPDYQMTG